MNWGIPFQLPDSLLINRSIYNASEGPLPEKLNFLKINLEDDILYACTAVLSSSYERLTHELIQIHVSSPLLLYSFQHF